MKIFTSISLIISVLLSLLGIGKTPEVKPLSEYNYENTHEITMLSVNKRGYVVNEDGEKIVLEGEDKEIEYLTYIKLPYNYLTNMHIYTHLYTHTLVCVI